MKAEIIYFKQNGKYYSGETIEVDGNEPLYMIWYKIYQLLLSGNWPGLVNGQHDFITLVNVPDHQHAHPHLILPGKEL